MKIQEKADVCYSREWTCLAMAETAPNQGEASLDNRGFTLVELLMVIAIIGVLSLMVIPQFSHLRNLAKNARCKSEIRTVEKSIIAYNLDNAKFPPVPLDATVTTTLLDPWGNPYQYYNIQNGGGTPYMNVNGVTPLNTDFDLYSTGVDGLSTGKLDPASTTSMDDIVRGADGAIVAMGSDY
jgi:general secretion pathway protein G